MLARMDTAQVAEEAHPRKKWMWKQPTPFRQDALQIAIAVIAAFACQLSCYPSIRAWVISSLLVLVMPTTIAFLFAGVRGNWRGFGNLVLVLTLLYIVATSQYPPPK
jgi:hypothetical protein